MSSLLIPDVRIAGLSACVPKNIAENSNFDIISTKERQLLIKTTGISQRRIAAEGMCASDLCYESAKQILNALNWNPKEIDLLLFVTQTPDYITPATAALLQHRLGLSQSCIAFDINLGCSGYVYGLSVAAGLLSNMPKGKGLLLVGDVSSACISGRDKSTTPIFSDAGSATALENDDRAPEMMFNLQTDGSGYQAIMIKEGGYRHPFNKDSLKEETIQEGITRNNIQLQMNGIDVFNFAIKQVPRNVNELLDKAGVKKNDIDFFVFHQANRLINEAIRKKLGITVAQTPYSLKNFGNTSSATIPVTLVTEIREAISGKELKMVLSGFGVGLSWGAVYLQTSAMVCPPLLEV